MRFMVMMAVFLGLLALPQSAAAQSNNYGRIYCSAYTPCIGETGFPDNATLAANANSCATQSYGAPAGGQYFDTISGLDGSGCLSTLPSAVQPNGDSKLAVQCCMIRAPNNLCTFKCELNKI